MATELWTEEQNDGESSIAPFFQSGAINNVLLVVPYIFIYVHIHTSCSLYVHIHVKLSSVAHIPEWPSLENSLLT